MLNPTRAWVAALVASALSLVHASPALGQRTLLDDFEDLSAWEVVASDGVVCHIDQAPGADGNAMRLSYDFSKGAGFCIVRRRADLDLDPNYRFDLRVRGDAPANDLEFKLVSPSGDDVWWVNRRGFRAPEAWTTLTQKARHFEFAWGPSGDVPLSRVGWFELAIAASQGGSGELLIDDLTYETLPEIEARPDNPIVRHTQGAAEFPITLEPGAASRVELSFPQPVEINAVITEWTAAPPQSYDVVLTLRDGRLQTHHVRHGGASLQGVFTPETEISSVSVQLIGDQPAQLERVELCPIDQCDSPNAFIERLAQGSETGRFPPAMSGVPTPWTVIGLPDDDHEALLTSAGDIETRKGGFTICPTLLINQEPVTWADVRLSTTLEDGYLPIPSVHWSHDDVSMQVTALATPLGANQSVLLTRYRIKNESDTTAEVGLALSAFPFQALPPWQQLNIFGGHTPVSSVEATIEGFWIDQQDRVRALAPAQSVAASNVSAASTHDRVGASDPSDARIVTDPSHGFASGTLVYRRTLRPGAFEDIVLCAPIGGGELAPINAGDPSEFFDHRLRQERDRWSALLQSPRVVLPEGHRAMSHAAKTTTAHILINQDGPKIQPGSRTYERSWIRDGSITSLALIAAGHTDRARAFADWYAPYQYETGKAPCVVDHRGPDPVDEHDSTGQLIITIWQVYLATGDLAFLQRHEESVRRGVEYLKRLRAMRLTDEYANSPDPIERAKTGLVPESISHEGYAAKPMHSYWDDFFVLRGLEDAAAIALELGNTDDFGAYSELAASFRQSLFDSVRLTMNAHQIEYIPGCVELGDFDATSTSIAVFPGNLLASELDAPLRATFERYWDHFVARRSGAIEWRDFTPYEFRLAATFVRLRQPDRALALLDWLMEQRTPHPWNQWPEIGYRDPQMTGFVGDIPHTWVGSAFLLSYYSLFAHERDAQLVLAPALNPDWLAHPDGVAISDFHTRWGTLAYTYKPAAGGFSLRVHEAPAAPEGMVVRPPADSLNAYLDGTPLTANADGEWTIPSRPCVIEFRDQD